MNQCERKYDSGAEKNLKKAKEELKKKKGTSNLRPFHKFQFEISWNNSLLTLLNFKAEIKISLIVILIDI